MAFTSVLYKIFHFDVAFFQILRVKYIANGNWDNIAYLVLKNIFDKMNLLDENYFIYFVISGDKGRMFKSK